MATFFLKKYQGKGVQRNMFIKVKKVTATATESHMFIFRDNLDLGNNLCQNFGPISF